MEQEPQTSWKVADLAESRVETETGELLGHLKDVLATGANDVFVVVLNGEEILIPALKTVVIKISPEEKKIIVRLPAGLKELYSSLKKNS